MKPNTPQWLALVMASFLLGANSTSATGQEQESTPKAVPPSQENLELPKAKLNPSLNTRLKGEMSHTFRDFSNMFLVKSRIEIGIGIGLMTKSKDVSERPLQSPYPETYKPTLRQLLNSIALQTGTAWRYDPSGDFISAPEGKKPPADELAIFEFLEPENPRLKPFKIDLAKDWEAEDMGNWVMHRPKIFPIGLDIYELGKFTPSSKTEKAIKNFPKKIRKEISAGWMKRVKPSAKVEELKAVKVGKYDALYFESMIPSRTDGEVKWRQWVLIDDNNRAYFIVSTIFPKHEKQLFPEVEKMVNSFQVRGHITKTGKN